MPLGAKCTAVALALFTMSSNCFASGTKHFELAPIRVIPEQKTNEQVLDELLTKCMNTLERANKNVVECASTTQTAPRWYEQPEFDWIFFSLGVSVGIFAGRHLK
jgi:hypothetical protein